MCSPLAATSWTGTPGRASATRYQVRVVGLPDTFAFYRRIQSRHMSKLSMFAAGIVLAMGCGSNDPLDKAIAGLEDWKNKMCACKDKACVEKVQEDYKKWENDVL